MEAGAFSSWSSEAMMGLAVVDRAAPSMETQQVKVEEEVEFELAKVRTETSSSAWCCGIQRYPFSRFL